MRTFPHSLRPFLRLVELLGLFFVLITLVRYGPQLLQGSLPALNAIIHLIILALYCFSLVAFRQWLIAVQQQQPEQLVAAERAVQRTWRWQPWLILPGFLSPIWFGPDQSGLTSASSQFWVVLLPVLLIFTVYFFFTQAVRSWILASTEYFLTKTNALPDTDQRRLMIWLFWGKWVSVVVMLSVTTGLITQALQGKPDEWLYQGIDLVTITLTASLMSIARRLAHSLPTRSVEGEAPVV